LNNTRRDRTALYLVMICCRWGYLRPGRLPALPATCDNPPAAGGICPSPARCWRFHRLPSTWYREPASRCPCWSPGKGSGHQPTRQPEGCSRLPAVRQLLPVLHLVMICCRWGYMPQSGPVLAVPLPAVALVPGAGLPPAAELPYTWWLIRCRWCAPSFGVPPDTVPTKPTEGALVGYVGM
jgi:hypothetical protein